MSLGTWEPLEAATTAWKSLDEDVSISMKSMASEVENTPDGGIGAVTKWQDLLWTEVWEIKSQTIPEIGRVQKKLIKSVEICVKALYVFMSLTKKCKSISVK